jgi:hypothetical protein
MLSRILIVTGIGLFTYGFSLFSGSNGLFSGYHWSVGWTMEERLIMVSGAVIATLGSVLGTKKEGTKE